MASVEFGITYQADGEKERLPSPKFEGIYWLGIPERLAGQRLLINGVAWEITIAGFQGSEGVGHTLLHPEGVGDGVHDGEQEDVYFISGKGSMTRWDGLDCGLSVTSDTPLKPVLSNDEARRATFELAVASYLPEWRRPGEEELEHLVLNVSVDGKTVPIEPVITPPGHYHATKLDGESLYFVLKRKKCN